MPSLLSFTIQGLPPRKEGANSMWRKPAEFPRLKALRRAAHAAMDGRAVYSEPIEVRILIFAGPKDGDLDHFIAGICGGLQRAHGRTPIRLADWFDLPVGALPSENILFSDDRWIERITAERLPPDAEGKRYFVEIFGY